MKLGKADVLVLLALPFGVASLLFDLVLFPHFDFSTWCAWIALCFLSLSYLSYMRKVEREKDPFLKICEPKKKGTVV